MSDNNNGILLMSLSKVFKMIDQYCYNVVKDDHLTKNEAIILMFLSNHPHFDTASDIIRIRGLSKAHVAQSVDSLCQKKYLETCVDQKDHRIQHLHIHSSAYHLIEKLNRERNKHLTVLFEGMSQEEKVLFMKMIGQIVENTKKFKEVK